MADMLNIKIKESTVKFYDIVKTKLNEEITHIKYLGGGSNGKAYRVTLSDESNIVIKAYRFAGMNEAEAKQLEILSDNTSVLMPDVIFTYSGNNIALLAMSYIEGKNVLNPIYLLSDKKSKQCFADNVIKGMLEWHSVTHKRFGDLDNPQYDTWHELYRQNKVNRILSGIEQLVNEGKYSNKKYDTLCEATVLYDKCYEEPENSVLIHGDLNIMNIMSKANKLELTGFIDPCDSMWADREYDLFQLQNMWGNKYFLYDTYKSKYGNFTKESDFRVAYYGLMNEISCLLKGGPHLTIWENLWFSRLEKQKRLLLKG